jgi:hypothetical protein
MPEDLTTNWKTTVIGILLAMLYAWEQAPAGLTLKAILITALITGFGVACKDFDNSGASLIDKMVFGHVQKEVNRQLQAALQTAEQPLVASTTATAKP